MNDAPMIRGAQRLGTSVLLAAALLPKLAATPIDAAQGQAEIFRGLVVSMGTVARGANTSLNIHISDWTSAEQRQVLSRALVEGAGGDEGLYELVRQQPEKGFLQVRNQAGTVRLKYAWQTIAADGSRAIALVADNLLPAFASEGAPRLRDQQFTVVFLEIDAAGSGSGSLAASASITWDAEAERIKIGIESAEPLRITSVRKVQ